MDKALCFLSWRVDRHQSLSCLPQGGKAVDAVIITRGNAEEEQRPKQLPNILTYTAVFGGIQGLKLFDSSGGFHGSIVSNDNDF